MANQVGDDLRVGVTGTSTVQAKMLEVREPTNMHKELVLLELIVVRRITRGHEIKKLVQGQDERSEVIPSAELDRGLKGRRGWIDNFF